MFARSVYILSCYIWQPFYFSPSKYSPVPEKFSTTEDVKYVLLILAIASVIAVTSVMMTSGRLSLAAGALVILTSYLAVLAVVRSFKRRFLSQG